MFSIRSIALSIAVAVGVVFYADAPLAAPKVSWSYYSVITVNHMFGNALDKTFKRIEERTDGEFKITFVSYGETPFNSTDALRVLNDKLVEMSEWIPEYTTGTFPIVGAPGLPFLNPEFTTTGDAQRRADKAWNTPAFREEFEPILLQHNAREIGRYYYEPMNFFCQKPINSPSDLQGERIRVFSPVQASLVRQLNASPVSLPAPEVYSALQRGVLSCLITSSGGVTGLKWHEQLKSVYTTNMAMISTSMLVRQDALDNLPERYRTILIEEMEKATSQMRRLLNESDAEHYETMKKMGFSVNRISSADYEHLRQLSMREVWPTWTERVGDRGTRVLDAITESLRD